MHRGETEAELGRKRRQQELDNCRADMATLRSASVAALSQRSVLEPQPEPAQQRSLRTRRTLTTQGRYAR